LKCAAGAAGFTFLPRHVWGANERLDIAIIGTGNISRFHLQTLPACGIDRGGSHTWDASASH
jgi:hypothetical protein